MMPEEIIKKLKKSIWPQWKLCFLTSVVLGVIAHLYKITNWLPNWDSLVFRYDAQNMVNLGRWMLPIVCAPSSFYDLPWLTGLLAIIFHSLGAVCICKMFNVKKSITAVMIGALVVTFPTVTSVMLYNYVADGYAISFLFACMAAMCIANKKPKYVLSAILIALSVGIYQAYITVTIMLLLCYIILEVIKEDVDIKELIITSVKYLATGVAGMLTYYLVLTAILKITGTELLEYQGLDNTIAFSGINIFESLYVVKNAIFEYFFNFSKGINIFNITNCVVVAITIVLYLTEIIRSKPSIAKILVILICLLLLPVGMCVLAFINSHIDYHNLMKMGFCVFYLFLILQYEKTDFKAKLNNIKQWAILTVMLVLTVNHIVIANTAYHKLQIAYEKSYGTLIRIADRIEQTDGAKNCGKVMVVGAISESEFYSAHVFADITGTTDGYILRADDEIVGISVLCSALNDYCGKNYEFVSGDDKEMLLKNPDVTKMNIWPEKNSVMTINDVIVIKLGVER